MLKTDAKVYLSGQISGLTEEQYATDFADAAEFIRSEGFIPVSPLSIPACPDESCGSDKTFSSGAYQHDWKCYMKYDIIGLFDCDAIFMLERWENSRGATIERTIAEVIGLPIGEMTPQGLIWK